MSEVPLYMTGSWIERHRLHLDPARGRPYSGTSLIKSRHPLGPYSKHMHRAL